MGNASLGQSATISGEGTLFGQLIRDRQALEKIAQSPNAAA
jgi:hypothetical protein